MATNDNSLRQYLITIGQFPLLTADEEKDLATRWRQGDESARQALINSNLKLVVSVAKKYHNNHMSLQDLISEGNCGLMTAVDKFDPTLGYRFSTCAVPWIKQAIMKALTDNGKNIRLPAHIYQLMTKYKRAIADMMAVGEEVTDSKLAAALDIDEDKVRLLRQYKHDTVSLETPLGDNGDDDTLGDLYADESDESPSDYTDRHEQRDLILAALKHLPERSQRIMKLRYGLREEGDPAEFETEHTLEEIGVMLHLTRERIRQLEKKSLITLKQYLR